MRYLVKVSYKGTNYAGWAKQVNEPSIQEEIESTLSKYFNSEIKIFGSGRTDAGVHALGQYFHFDVDKDVDLDKCKYSLNRMLSNDIHIISIKEVCDDFHARYNAKSKYYRYDIIKGENDPFNNDSALIIPYAFDEELFIKALKLFEGTHNYQSFTSKESDENNFIRTIYSIEVTRENNKLSIHIKGNGFMRYMIRYIIGTAIAVAINKEDISFISSLLNSDNRKIVSYKIDAKGLYLVDVTY